MGFLSRANELEKTAQELMADALKAFSRRPRYEDTSLIKDAAGKMVSRHQNAASQVLAMLAFQRKNSAGKAMVVDGDGKMPERDSIQEGYGNLSGERHE